MVLIESTGPSKENMDAAVAFVKQLGVTLSDNLDAAQVQ